SQSVRFCAGMCGRLPSPSRERLRGLAPEVIANCKLAIGRVADSAGFPTEPGFSIANLQFANLQFLLFRDPPALLPLGRGEEEPASERRRSLVLITSPPLAVMSDRSVSSGTVLRMKRAEPSQKAALKPPGNTPSFGSGFFGSNGRSSGFVHGTPSAASTNMNVFDVPSVMLAIRLPRLPSKSVPRPVKAR